MPVVRRSKTFARDMADPEGSGSAKAPVCLDLLQLAQVNMDEFTYLHGLPEYLLAMLDTALIVNEKTLPVYGFVLAACSAVLSEMLVAQKLDSSTSTGVATSQIPLIGDCDSGTLLALNLIYQNCVLCKPCTSIKDEVEAKAIVEFGRKYNVSMLLEAGDAYLSKWLRPQCNNLQSTCCIRATRSDAKLAALQANQILLKTTQTAISWGIYAEEKELPKTLKYCETLLAHSFSVLPTTRLEFSRLSKESVLRVMAVLSEKYKEASAPYSTKACMCTNCTMHRF